MTEPTYRIETEYEPTNTVPWRAGVFRVIDGEKVANTYGTTEQRAIDNAREMIARISISQTGHTLYATEDGELCDAPEPQSLRA